jgi:hypothetical protein
VDKGKPLLDVRLPRIMGEKGKVTGENKTQQIDGIDGEKRN